jgi:DNA-binding MurR/RpiR family transcriptional regulator
MKRTKETDPSQASATAENGPRPTVRLLIKEVGDGFSPAERKVARALLAEYPVAGLETVSRLSSRARVSGPTVIRFADRLGFAGYPAMQEALRQEVQDRMTSPLSQYSQVRESEDGELVALSKQRFLSAIDRTFVDLPEAELNAAVGLLADRKRPLLTIGGRFSQAAAYYLTEHLNMLRPNTRLGGQLPIWDELIDVGKRHVFVAFDFRRYQNDTIKAAKHASERGATIVLFTDPWLSPIADFADHVLPARVEAMPPFDSMIPAFALVEAVVAGVTARLGEAAKSRIEELEQLRLGSTWDATPADGDDDPR